MAGGCGCRVERTTYATPTGRACRQANGIELTAARASLNGSLQANASTTLRVQGTRRGPFNSTPMAVNSISFASSRARPMWALSTYVWCPFTRPPNEIKNSTHPKTFTALFRAQGSMATTTTRVGRFARRLVRALLRATVHLDRDLTCVLAWCGALTRYSGAWHGLQGWWRSPSSALAATRCSGRGSATRAAR